LIAPRRIAVIGGGVGGITAALSMLRAKFEVAPDLVTLPRRSSEPLPPSFHRALDKSVEKLNEVNWPRIAR
jgi:NADH dehydrogenase FAD-containing subunit